jgi:hypothetical protein
MSERESKDGVVQCSRVERAGQWARQGANITNFWCC